MRSVEGDEPFPFTPDQCHHRRYVDGECVGCGRMSERGKKRRAAKKKGPRARLVIYDELLGKSGFDADGNMQG